MALSALARNMRKGRFKELRESLDLAEPQTDPKEEVLGGFTRGTLGVQGSTIGVEDRNPDAGEDKDRRTLQSPIMESFIQRTT